MRLDQFNVPADVKRHLSPVALTDVVAQFQPDGDCYICRQPLGTNGRFSLRLDENGPVAVAVPSHAPCHASSASSVTAVGVPQGTYRTVPVGIPIESQQGQSALLPMLLVNPSIDVVTLTRDDDGRLRDNREDTLLSLGWVQYGRGVPFRGDSEAVGSVSPPARPGGDWTISTLMGTWSVDMPPEIAQTVAEHGSLFVMALHMIPVTGLSAADDPYEAVMEAIHNEPAMLGRCEYKR